MLLIPLVLAGPFARAGTIEPWSKGPEQSGKITVTATGLKIEGATTTELKLGDVLEADFADAPPAINYFSSTEQAAPGLPPDWKVTDVGKVSAPGSASFAAGVFTLLGAQRDGGDDRAERATLLGRMWSGDGQWTVRITSIPEGFPRAGMMLREADRPGVAYYGVGTWDNNNAFSFGRSKRGDTYGDGFEAHDYPQWFRLTRRGSHLTSEFSNDGQKWIVPGQYDIDLDSNFWIGFFFPALNGKGPHRMVFDHVLFTPPPGLLIHHGVLLRSGSFLTGAFDPLDFLTAAPTGKFSRNPQENFQLASAQVCAAVYCPIEERKVIGAAAQGGALLPNGDFMQGTYEAINGGGVRLDSVTFGTTTYQRQEIAAATLHPLAPLPADYEVRLTDGSRIAAKGLTAVGDKVTINEISGLDITVPPGEIAQVRAGSARVQDLLALPWATKTSEEAKAAADSLCWAGPNQTKMLALSAGTQAEFTLNGGPYRAVAFHAQFPSGASASPVTLHVLADGREVEGGTTRLTAPLFVQLPLKAAKTIAIAAESSAPAHVLIVDPVAIRANAP